MLNLRNEKNLINCFYEPQNTMITNHCAKFEKFLNLHSSKHEKILILRDFNVDISTYAVLFETSNSTRLTKQPICNKKSNSPTMVDLFWQMLPASCSQLKLVITITWLVSLWTVGLWRAWHSMSTLTRYEWLKFYQYFFLFCFFMITVFFVE